MKAKRTAANRTAAKRGKGSPPAPPRLSHGEKFDYSLDYAALDFRSHPELYRMGKGEQGVLMVQPYKSEILPHWRFRTPAIAEESAKAIYRLFQRYRDAGDFAGMDMARKFLQMGITRSRRYANHASGRKYKPGTREKLPLQEDKIKAECAEIFSIYYRKAKEDPDYASAVLARKRPKE